MKSLHIDFGTAAADDSAVGLLRGRIAWLRMCIEQADREIAGYKNRVEEIERKRALDAQSCDEMEEAVAVLEAAALRAKAPAEPEPDGARAFLPLGGGE